MTPALAPNSAPAPLARWLDRRDDPRRDRRRVALPASTRVYLAYDLDPRLKKARADFSKSRKAEAGFSRKLRMIADHIAKIVRSMNANTLTSAYHIGQWAARYSEMLIPWAQSAVAIMHQEVAARDKKQWAAHAAEMGRNLERLIDEAPVGEAMRGLMGEQVELIRSLPLETAQRVHEMTTKALTAGTRPAALEDEIIRIGDVTRSKARLIARTETARTASILTQVRAQAIGSEGYIWRTARDSNVRKTHKALEGKFIKWTDPPECDPGYHAHAGQIFNCRCWAEPVLKFD